jgi:hypothetical protein
VIRSEEHVALGKASVTGAHVTDLQLAQHLKGLFVFWVGKMFSIWQAYLVGLPLDLVILGDDLAWVHFDCFAEIILKIGVCRYLGGMTDTRSREDIMDKVLYVFIVSAAISKITVGLKIFLSCLRPLDLHIIS